MQTYPDLRHCCWVGKCARFLLGARIKMNRKEQISIEQLSSILVELKFENDNFITQFNDFSKDVDTGNDKLLEYVIYDLFTDIACFVLALGQKKATKLSQNYAPNILLRLTTKGYKLNLESFENLYMKRQQEYYQYLKEYDKEYFRKVDIASYTPGLGKAFSANFCGYRNCPLIVKAHIMFVLKLKHFYGKFLKKIVEELE
ncbi:MAG: hypothetical protein L6308_02815 [Candidatus Omnitrophica bacterium]|nr:hypothetical protein [Candidatus Omnitrophota bacterium]